MLAVVKNGKSKPICHKESLGTIFHQYVKKYPDFEKQINDLRPDWLTDEAQENKDKLLKMAKDGLPRPNSSKDKLGQHLQNYLKWDVDFSKEIKEIGSHWFIDTVEININNLLELAKIPNSKKPKLNTEMGNKLVEYTCSKKKNNYKPSQPEFDKKIRLLRPDWFEDKVAIRKDKILELAKNNGLKPTSKNEFKTFFNYTNKNHKDYDAEFDKEIRLLRPDWFIDISTENKKKLLEMAKNGESRPNKHTHDLGSVLVNYTNEGKCFDEAFNTEIRTIRPDWFLGSGRTGRKGISDKNKQELLDMAKQNKPRPSSKLTKIGKCLGSYTQKSSINYDESFDKQIRLIIPQWF